MIAFVVAVRALLGLVWRAERNADPSRAGTYPNGSVPDGAGPESTALRAIRFACASVNNYPRRFTGSWCMGYGYVCGRCHMYADPVSKEHLQQMCDALNALPAEEQQMAAAQTSGGGPSI